MFTDQSVSNWNSPTPQIDRSRIKVIMDSRTAAGWPKRWSWADTGFADYCGCRPPRDRCARSWRTVLIETAVVATMLVALLGLPNISLGRRHRLGRHRAMRIRRHWAANTGVTLYGGLQISQATWDSNGGRVAMAASPQQQITRRSQTTL